MHRKIPQKHYGQRVEREDENNGRVVPSAVPGKRDRYADAHQGANPRVSRKVAGCQGLQAMRTIEPENPDVFGEQKAVAKGTKAHSPEPLRKKDTIRIA